MLMPSRVLGISDTRLPDQLRLPDTCAFSLFGSALCADLDGWTKYSLRMPHQ
jgi:hypothetical protein